MEQRIINNMIQAMHLTKSDVVLLNFWGNEDDISDLHAFEKAFQERGIVFHSLKLTDADIISLVEENQNGLPADWFSRIKDTTVVIDLIDKPIGVPPTGLPKEKYPIFGGILGDLFGFMSRHDKMLQITLPSVANAEMANMPYEKYKERLLLALDVDYEEMNAACQKKMEEFKGNRRIIQTGENCELIMDTTGREWYIDAGEGAFPCGEIYIAPVENQTNGSIFFQNLAVEGVGVYQNVTLTIRDGRFISSNCEAFNQFMNGVDEENANVVAELGIGMNPNVEGNEGDSTIDENALGTFHIALGMNHMFGGTNNCRFHMDFVTKGVIL